MASPSSPTPTVDAADFARSVSAHPDSVLAQFMKGDYRAFILDEIFRRMEEHFDPAKADGTDAVIRWKITAGARNEPDRFQVTVRDGTCRVSRDLVGRPRVTFTIGPVDFLKLVTGNASGPALFLRRKLRIRGDLVFAARVAELFRIPRV